MGYINNNDLGLVFNFSIDINTTNSLDLTLVGDRITRCIKILPYRKPTATNSTLMTNSNHPVFCTTYSPQFNQVKSIIAKYLPILQLDQDMSTILSQPVEYVARRARTIGNLVSPVYLLWKNRM